MKLSSGCLNGDLSPRAQGGQYTGLETQLMGGVIPGALACSGRGQSPGEMDIEGAFASRPLIGEKVQRWGKSQRKVPWQYLRLKDKPEY